MQNSASGASRVLIVEDHLLVALDLETTVKALGYEVVGPAGTLERAKELACSNSIDAALLDINLGDENVFPVALALQERGIPFIFTTGYSRSVLPNAFRDCPYLEKPVTAPELRHALAALLGNPGQPPSPAGRRAASSSYAAPQKTFAHRTK